MSPVCAHEPNPAWGHRLEPAQRQQTAGIGRVDGGSVGARGAREREQGLPRLAWLEGLQDQFGQPVAERKR